MKSLKNLFLFFFTLTVLFFSQNRYSVFAQQSTDSLNYYSNLAQQPQNASDLTKAYQFFNKSKENSFKKKDTVMIIYCLYNNASIEYKGGSYFESENSAVNALKLLDKLNETPYLIKLRKGLITHLGMLYREQNNADKAIALYENAFEISESIEDSLIIYNNRSNIYKDQKDYDNADVRLQPKVNF